MWRSEAPPSGPCKRLPTLRAPVRRCALAPLVSRALPRKVPVQTCGSLRHGGPCAGVHRLGTGARRTPAAPATPGPTSLMNDSEVTAGVGARAGHGSGLRTPRADTRADAPSSHTNPGPARFPNLVGGGGACGSPAHRDSTRRAAAKAGVRIRRPLAPAPCTSPRSMAVTTTSR